ncbi:hypothetical protein [Solimicrobium silvestre]|nr:hypothetical protein [Solimicrobium silvestre]
MKICEICGSILEECGTCLFNVPEDKAPCLADYEAMARGEMSHAEHQIVVGRWALHNTELQSQKTLIKMREFADSAWGKKVKIFKM